MDPKKTNNFNSGRVAGGESSRKLRGKIKSTYFNPLGNSLQDKTAAESSEESDSSEDSTPVISQRNSYSPPGAHRSSRRRFNKHESEVRKSANKPSTNLRQSYENRRDSVRKNLRRPFSQRIRAKHYEKEQTTTTVTDFKTETNSYSVKKATSEEVKPARVRNSRKKVEESAAQESSGGTSERRKKLLQRARALRRNRYKNSRPQRHIGYRPMHFRHPLRLSSE